MMYEEELRVAVDAVRQASRLCRVVQSRLVSSLTKGDRSPVTVADYGAQAVVSQLLHEAFPHDPLVGEEDAAALRLPENKELCEKVITCAQAIRADLQPEQILQAIDRGLYEGGAKGRHWTLDPIDGTKGFLRGEQYAVALALIENGEVVLGVLGCPNLAQDVHDTSSEVGSLFVAVKGQGAYSTGIDHDRTTPLAVSTSTDFRFCESVEKAHSSQSDAAKIAALLGVSRPPLRIDSQCKYAVVARGDVELYLRLPTRKGYQEKIWDHAAGWRVVVEAGGRVTDVFGKELDFSQGRKLTRNTGVIVSNNLQHARILAAVQQVLQLG